MADAGRGYKYFKGETVRKNFTLSPSVGDDLDKLSINKSELINSMLYELLKPVQIDEKDMEITISLSSFNQIKFRYDSAVYGGTDDHFNLSYEDNIYAGRIMSIISMTDGTSKLVCSNFHKNKYYTTEFGITISQNNALKIIKYIKNKVKKI